MEGKLMNHIEFKFIRNVYPLHEKLFCYFQTPNGSQWQPEIGDWVGLYKIGWNTLKEHKIRKLIQNEWLESQRRNVDYIHVIFEQHELPKDIEGLYQFVYVTKNDVVKGISPSFRFERVLPVPQQVNDLRRMVDVIEKVGQEMTGSLPRPLERCEPMNKIENELIKECQRLNLNWGKVTDEVVNGKLMQKYLNNLRLIQKDDEVTKKVEELFVENGKLCMSLRTRIQEVSELKKECEDIKSMNGDLLSKLQSAERKVEQLEREKELNIRKIEELAIKEQLPRGYEGKHVLHDLEETAKWLLQDDERVQPELKRTTSFYGDLETPFGVKLVQRILDEPLTSIQKRSHPIEKILRGEVEGTQSQVRLLKRVIEDLKNDNELLRERVRQIDTELVRPEVQVPGKTMIKEVTVCPRINLVPVDLLGLHGETKQHHSLPIVEPTSISVSTFTVPTGELQPTPVQKSTLTITGKINNGEEQKQQLRGQVGEYLNRLDEQIRSKIEERLRNKLQEPWQSTNGQQQQQPRVNIVESTTTTTTTTEQQQTPLTTPRPMYKFDDLVRQKIEKQRQPWSFLPQQQQQQQPLVNDELFPKWRLQQQLRDEIEQPTTMKTTTTTTTTMTTMCPVCGIVMPSELNVCDFEIHVNSHFTD